jgi:phosphopantothenate---cysteine ligase (CTP)
MKCLVTAGPTFEPLDDVRRLTNFSTGRLGSELVNALAAAGHEVILLIGQQATWRGERNAAHIETFTTTASLRDKLSAFATPDVRAVFHAAAVSDFSFGQVWMRGQDGALSPVHARKISTRKGNLFAELVPTPKIIASLRDWFPKACLVGWKYEADGDRAQVCSLALQQVGKCRTNACVANGPAYGPGFGLVTATAPVQHLPGLPDLFAGLLQFSSETLLEK